MTGQRKLLLGAGYLAGCFTVGGIAVYHGTVDLYGLAALCISWATGLGVVIWGNVQEHRARNTASG